MPMHEKQIKHNKAFGTNIVIFAQKIRPALLAGRTKLIRYVAVILR